VYWKAIIEVHGGRSVPHVVVLGVLIASFRSRLACYKHIVEHSRMPLDKHPSSKRQDGGSDIVPVGRVPDPCMDREGNLLSPG
jgi:hypothetical protein